MIQPVAISTSPKPTSRACAQFVSREISNLICAGFYWWRGIRSEFSSKLADKLMTDETAQSLDPLRATLRLSGEDYIEGVFAWKGFLYYSWVMAEFKPLLKDFRPKFENLPRHAREFGRAAVAGRKCVTAFARCWTWPCVACRGKSRRNTRKRSKDLQSGQAARVPRVFAQGAVDVYPDRRSCRRGQAHPLVLALPLPRRTRRRSWKRWKRSKFSTNSALSLESTSFASFDEERPRRLGFKARSTTRALTVNVFRDLPRQRAGIFELSLPRAET